MNALPDGRVLVGRVLQLDHRERQAVDEEHDVGPALVLAFDDRELVDRQPVVVGRIVEVDHPRLVAADGAVRAPVLDRDAVDEHPVDGTVALDERRRVGARQLPVGVLDGLGREVRVQAGERVAEPPLEDDIAVVGCRVRSAPGAPKAISGPWRTS